MSQPSERLDICAGRPYGNDGKKNWIRVGEMTIWSDGGYSIRLDAVPTGNWFDGQLKCFKQERGNSGGQRTERPQQSRNPNAGSRSAPMAQPPSQPPADGFNDDDIPF